MWACVYNNSKCICFYRPNRLNRLLKTGTAFQDLHFYIRLCLTKRKLDIIIVITVFYNYASFIAYTLGIII